MNRAWQKADQRYSRGMPLFLTVHAVRQSQRRGISLDEVREALANVHTTYPSDDDPEERQVHCGDTKAGRRLKVITLVTDSEFVITVADRDEDG